MNMLAAGFWGAFFCTATLMLVISLAAFLRSHRRVALMAGLSSLFSAAFVVGYLGWLPVEGEVEARVLAHMAVGTAVSLALMLMSTLGMLRQRDVGRPAVLLLVGAGVLVVVAGWALEPRQSLVLGSATAFCVGSVMLMAAMRGARRGDRSGWTIVAGIVCMLVAIAGLSWIALGTAVPWQVHAVSAAAGVAYLCVVATVLWARYSYLLELAEVMAHGPSYDPVTRMRSHSETGQMVGSIFLRRNADPQPVGVLAISIANLYALENLHGRAAFNHALFVTASRLRRSAPQNVEMGRLGEDGFLLLVPHAPEVERLEQLARQIRDRLVRPVTLSTSRDPAGLEGARTAWAAEIGIGVLCTSTHARPSQVVATARAMARTAWSYRSRLACYDDAAGQIVEMPADDGGVPSGPAPA